MTSRLAPIPPGEWPEEMAGALAALRPPRPRHEPPRRRPEDPKGLNLLGTMAHHPDAARAYHTLCGHVLFGTTLSERQRELLVLRVASRRAAAYEWAQHVVLARRAGLSDAEIEAVRGALDRDAPGGNGWSRLDVALIEAADDLVDDARIGDRAWAELAADLDAAQLIDVVLTVGAYEVLAMLLRSFDVALDDDLRS